MAAIVQYEFNNAKQWENAGLPKLIDTAHSIVDLGLNETTGKYHVEVLFENTDEVPDNGLLSAKSVAPKPHRFIGYPTLEEYEATQIVE